jgi:hypothetical protein
MKCCLKGGILIDTYSWPLGYVLWCCGSRSQVLFTFFQIFSWLNILGNYILWLFIYIILILFFRKHCECKFTPIVGSDESTFPIVCIPRKSYRPSSNCIYPYSKSNTRVWIWYIFLFERFISLFSHWHCVSSFFELRLWSPIRSE